MLCVIKSVLGGKLIMKIVHICLCGAMTDGFNYQENVITKYHKKMGYDVTIIASQWIWDSAGKLQKLEKTDYINENGVKVIRLPIRHGDVNNRLKIYPDLYGTVEIEQPDILFIHDCQFLDIRKMAVYARRHPNVKVYIDNHVDYSNGAHGWISKNLLHKGLWRLCVKKIEPYVIKFYGVLPARVNFLKEMYGLPANKCELLVMGADDELVEKVKSTRDSIRNRYGIKEEDFLIVTGGKINQFRPETLELMSAVSGSNYKEIKMLIFGSVDDSLKPQFDSLCEDDRIQFVGWQDVKSTYCIMNAADLIVFPGLHSVMWEQAVALGIPCVFRDIDGFHHVDLGGNAVFLKDVTEDSLKNIIENLYLSQDEYMRMRDIANKKGMQYFSYENISKRSIEK